MNPFGKKDQSEPAQATYVQPTDANSLETEILDSSLESTSGEAKILAQQEKEAVVAHASERFEHIERLERNHRIMRYAMIAALLVSVGAVIFLKLHSTPPKTQLSSVNQKYGTQKLNLDKLNTDKNPVGSASSNSIDVNGELHVNNSLILTPAPEPANAVAGQLYYDADTGELKIFDGETFNTLPTTANVVTNLGGATGSIDVGAGLALVDNQIVSTGVQSIAAGDNVNIQDDGAGNLTISSSASGSVGSPNGTAGRIAKFTGTQTIADSLLSEAGSAVTVNGSLNITGSLNLSSALSVSQGGTGLSSLTANQLLFASSANTISQLGNGSAGQCLLSNGGGSAPSFQACPGGGGGGVTSLNGETGIVTIANASGASGIVTINDAAADDSTKGIASFSSSNFSATSGNVSIKAGGISTTEISDGTITNADLAGGTYTSITGVGILSAGSITSGFGTIATVNTITGTTVNGTVGINTGLGAGTQRIDASGNLVNIGTISASGLITANNGLTVSGGTITLGTLTGGASTCLTLNASSQVGTATCATGSGSNPTLQNVYDNSGVTPNILLNSSGKGVTIQDAAISVGGNLLAVKNNAGTTTYLGVTTTGADITGSLSVSSNVTISSLLGGAAAGQCLTTDASGKLQLVNCLSGSGGGSGGVLSLNGLSGSISISNATVSGQNVIINNAAADGSTKGIASFSSSNFTATSGNVSIKTGGVTATEIADGTIANADLAGGTYSAITGTGALTAGSIASGFGTIATTNTITGSVVNGTTSIRTGAGAGTTRIDASGNLSNIGTISTSGLITGGNGLTISAGTVTLSGLTGGASTCLTLNASSQVSTATCATGSGSSPTLQDVYNNSGATPNILLASLGKGVTIQDAAVSVGGNLLAVKNNAGTTTYLGVTTTGTSINGNISATGSVTFSNLGTGVAVLNSGALTSATINLGSLPAYISGTLPVGNGGTGASSLGSTNGVIYYDGTKLATSNAGTTGQCLLATTGSAPSFGTCTGAGGVSSITATTTQTGALTLNSTAGQVSVTNSGNTFTFSTPQSIATTSNVQFNSVNASSLLQTAGTTRIDASGNLSNIGTISTSGLITAGNGLTISAGTVTLNNLTGGSSTCLTLNGSNQVGTATCATGSSSSPTLQNVYDNSSTTPNILLSSTGKGITIQDAASTVGGNLLAVKNNAGSTTYFGVTTSGAAVTGSLSVSSTVTLSSLTGGSAAGQCLTTDNGGNLVLTTCLGGGGGGSGGVVSLNGLSGSISIANASGSGATITIDNATTTTKGIASFASGNFAVTSGAVSIKTGGVTTTEIANGTIADADLSTGTFSNVTGTGILTAGSIASGFGTIATVNTITGTSVNGTTGINTGAGAGTQRITSGGNLVNIGTINTSGLITGGNGLTISSGTITLSNLVGGSGQCLTLNASSVVGVSTCATGAGTTPTLQNVYDNSTTSPNIILSATGGGVVIQDAASTVGDLFSVTDSSGATPYFYVGNTGILIGNTLVATGSITFSNLASANGGVVFANTNGDLSVTSNAGTSGQCLLSNGSGNAPSFAACPGNGALPTNGTATDNRISKFTNSATKLTNSQIADDGTHVSVGGTGTTGGLFNVGTTDQFQVASSGAVTAVGVNAGAGLIQGSAGLTISGGNITLSSVSGGTASTCLALNASNQVVSTSCAPGTGGGSTNNYILNQATLQSSANFFIQGSSNSVTAVVQGASGAGNPDIIDFKASGGATVASIDYQGHIKYVAHGTSGATLVCQNASGYLAGCSSSYQTALTFNNGLTNTSGTVGLGGTLSSATTLAAGNANNLTITSDLSGGGRSSYALNITQANDATNNNSVGLLNLTNSDTSSTAAVLNISQVTNGTAINIATGSSLSSAISINSALTSGTGVALNGVGALTSGYGVYFNEGTAGTNNAFTGALINGSGTRNYTTTGQNQTGNSLNLNRTTAINVAGGTLTVSGAVANLQSTCLQTLGTCTDTSNILNIGQNYANATGAVLNASNAGSGSIINLTQSKALGSNAAISLNYTGGTGTDILLSLQNSGSPKFTVDANGNVVALGTYNTNTFNSNTLTFGSASTATISSNGANILNLDTGGAASLNIGTTNANAVNISKSGITTTINGSATISQLLTANAGLNVSAGSTFTNASSTLNTSIALGNLASGAIGANTATVDVSTSFTINPSAGGRTYSLPAPTNTAAGRIVYISNISGSFSFTITGVTVPAGGNAGFLWNGTAWAASNVSTGASIVGTLDTGGTPVADGALISGNTLYLQSATSLFPGLVNTSAQSFNGAKTFGGGLLTAGAGFTASGGAISLTGNAASTFTTSSGALTLTSAAAATWGTSAGDLTVQANGTSNLNLKTTGAGTINIGTVGSVNTSTTVHIADSTAAVQTVSIGSNSSTSSVLISGGTGTAAGSEAIRIIPNDLGAVTIGGVNQTGSINVGVSTKTNTVNIANGATAIGETQTVNIGAGGVASSTTNVTIGGNSDASNTTIQSGSGSINLLTNGGSGSTTGTLVKSITNNSTNAFQVQNTAGRSVLSVDTTNSKTTLGNITSSAGQGVQGTLVFADGTNSNLSVTVQASSIAQSTIFTLPTLAGASNNTGTICVTYGSGSSNCTANGTAGGDLSGTYPNPTVAKIRNTNVTFTSIATGDVLQYNGTDIVNGKVTNTNLSAGTFTNITGVGSQTINFGFAQNAGSGRTISIAQRTAAGVGDILTVQGGQGNGANAGGALLLMGGAQGSSGGTGSVIVRANGTDSTTAFLVQNATLNTVFSIDTTAVSSANAIITLGNVASGNYIQFNPTAGTSQGLTAYGTARHSKTITLPAEYVGAVLSSADSGGANCSTNNNGTMTSGYSGDTSPQQNYYQWVSGVASNQCYDVVVQVPIPTDFDGWTGSPSLYVSNTSSTTSAVCMQAYVSAGVLDSAYSSTYACAPAMSGTLTARSFTALGSSTASYTTSGLMTLKIRMTSSGTANFTQIGTLSLTYNSKF